MSSIVNKVKDAMRGDDTDRDNRYGTNTYRTQESGPQHIAHHQDDDYGISTTTTTGTTSHVTRSRTPATNDEYDTNSTAVPVNRHAAAASGHTNLSPTTKQGATNNPLGRSEAPPLPGREPPTVPARRNEGGTYVPSTDTHTGPTGADIGTSGDRIGEARTGKPAVPHTGTYNHTSDNRGLVDRSLLMDPASKDAGSNVMVEPSTKIVSPTTTREEQYDDGNGKYGSIHDLRKSQHEKRGENENRNNGTTIFGTGNSNDINTNGYDHRRNTFAEHNREHNAGLTAQQRENRDSNIAGATGPAGLAASSSIQRRAVGGGNNNRDSYASPVDEYHHDDPAVRTHFATATTGTTLPQGGIHNGIIGLGSGREDVLGGRSTGTNNYDSRPSGTNNYDPRSTITNKYDSNIPTIVPSVGPAPRAANDHRFDDDDNNGNSFHKNNTRYGNGTGIGSGDNRSAFNDSRFGLGDSKNNNSNIDGVGFRSGNNNNTFNNNRGNNDHGRTTDDFGRVINDNNSNRNQNTFDRNNNQNTFDRNNNQNTFDPNNDNNYGRNSNAFSRGANNSNSYNDNNRNSGMYDNHNNDNYNRGAGVGGIFGNRNNDNYNRNDGYGRNNERYNELSSYNNSNTNNNNRWSNSNSGPNQPWKSGSGPSRSNTGQLVTGLFGNPQTGLDHHGPGYNTSKVMHECDHCGADNDITHYFRKDAVYRLHRI